MQTLAETLPCRPRGGILPPQAEYCETDGSLRMGFAPVLDVQLRLSSWPDGLELQRWEPDGWVREDADPQLLQVASVEGLPPEHAFRRFASSLPDEVRRVASRYSAWQLTALRLLRDRPETLDLARDAPNLFWLVASVVDRHSVSMCLASMVLERRRVEVLRWCVGNQASPAMLRFLQKVAIRSYARRELEVLERALRDPEIVAWFRHEPEVDIDDVRRVAISPWLRDYPFFREGLRAARQRPALVAELAGMATDVQRLADALGRDDAHSVLDRCRSVANLRRLHDRWTEQVNERLAERIRLGLHAEFGDDHFPPPPLAGTESIVPITNLDELASEALEMHHCASSYARAIFEGRSYLYRVLAPERATLEVQNRGSTLTLVQLRGDRNAEVGEATARAVQEWLVP